VGVIYDQQQQGEGKSILEMVEENGGGGWVPVKSKTLTLKNDWLKKANLGRVGG